MLEIAIVIPVLNDYASLNILLAKISNIVSRYTKYLAVDIYAIDDYSAKESKLIKREELRSINIIKLESNLGHQRAIAIGLAHLTVMDRYHKVIIMDSDGEDRPSDIIRLIYTSISDTEAIIVARRVLRSEGFIFSLYYYLYKKLFLFSTGKTIDFGNYCLIPGGRLSALVHTPSIWNHLASTIMRSKIPIVKIDTARGKRYTGKSNMNLSSLVAHGISAISVFVDTVVVRLFISIAFAWLLAIVVFIVWLTFNIAIHRYIELNYVYILLSIILVGGVSSLLTILFSFWILNRREVQLFYLLKNYDYFIKEIRVVK